MIFYLLSIFSLLVGSAHAIVWGLTLPSGNSWTSLSYVLTVPQLPPYDVMASYTDGVDNAWYFWCGLEPPSLPGVLQPVLQWGEQPNNGYVGDGGWSPYEWLVVLWAELDGLGTYSPNSLALSVSPGDQVQMSVVLSSDGQQWEQTATCLSGSCMPWSTYLFLPWDQLFSSSAMNYMICESELHGLGDQWDFDVTFTDITLGAANTQDVVYTCNSLGSTSDSSGSVAVNGLKIAGDYMSCSWDSIVLSPP
ncbi:hypothetical protein CALVIDRAFT_560421 [Calocera viscosa TUFC12733]|uniref:Uncharacterized protein n=1 Tax=Calocera viscosa (strain TUFC12733) TaxID=1330018 RepID=A0A167R168_CALVF|nr:hypothetical protein CALVIDRAFT_560421 [Calocera viscosa TUFC12733]